MMQSIHIEHTSAPKPKPKASDIGFGKYFTDHMFILDYDAGKGWHDARIQPYQPITLDPAAKVFHYGQAIFEGLKAYRTEAGNLVLFRPEMNIKRLNRSNDRMSIPVIDEELVLEALHQLVLIDQIWIPHEPGTSLYIRPFVIATEDMLGVSPSKQYKFMIIMSPVGAYYDEGVKPISIYVESEFVRAVAGGVGHVKTAGNYAAGLKAQEGATLQGCAQVLWLDGVHRKYVEEVGSMNVFFHLGDKIVTPALTGGLLPGITRDSVIHLLRYWGLKVEERLFSIDELVQVQKDGNLKEMFGTGTAAVISPVGSLVWKGETLTIGDGSIGELAAHLYETITGIQTGRVEDPFGWRVVLK